MKRGLSTTTPTAAEAARIVACKSSIFDWGRVGIGDAAACWLWRGSLNTWGYGDCVFEGRRVNASRAAYISKNGWIEPGLVVCHKCDNPACCNPSHLFAATQAENLADCRAKGRARGMFKGGAAHPRHTAKITQEMVREAQRLFAEGVSQSEIGRRWGLHSSSISRAIRGQSWGDIR